MRLIRLLLCLFFFAVNAFAKSSEPLTVLAVENYPPFYYVQNKEMKGLHIDIAKMVFDKAGIKYKMVPRPIKRIMSEIERGGNLVSLGIYKTDERLKFSVIDGAMYYPAPLVMVVNKSKADKLKNGMKIDEMFATDLNFAVVAGLSYGKWADDKVKALKPKAAQSEVDMEGLVTMVGKGRFDYVLAYPEMAKYYLEKNPELYKSVTFVKIGDAPKEEIPDYFMFSKTVDAAVVKKVVDTMNDVIKTDTYKDLVKKYSDL